MDFYKSCLINWIHNVACPNYYTRQWCIKKKRFVYRRQCCKNNPRSQRSMKRQASSWRLHFVKKQSPCAHTHSYTEWWMQTNKHRAIEAVLNWRHCFHNVFVVYPETITVSFSNFQNRLSKFFSRAGTII